MSYKINSEYENQLYNNVSCVNENIQPLDNKVLESKKQNANAPTKLVQDDQTTKKKKKKKKKNKIEKDFSNNTGILFLYNLRIG
jgi:hypothetical protein